MNQKPVELKKDTRKKTQIIGIHFSPEMAKSIKEEAARRNMKINRLFHELWEDYLKNQKGS
jgi:hypothetical protein